MHDSRIRLNAKDADGVGEGDGVEVDHKEARGDRVEIGIEHNFEDELF